MGAERVQRGVGSDAPVCLASFGGVAWPEGLRGADPAAGPGRCCARLALCAALIVRGCRSAGAGGARMRRFRLVLAWLSASASIVMPSHSRLPALLHSPATPSASALLKLATAAPAPRPRVCAAVSDALPWLGWLWERRQARMRRVDGRGGEGGGRAPSRLPTLLQEARSLESASSHRWSVSLLRTGAPARLTARRSGRRAARPRSCMRRWPPGRRATPPTRRTCAPRPASRAGGARGSPPSRRTG